MANIEQSYLHVQIQPGSAQNKVIGYKDGVLKIKIAAPPVEGKANRKLVVFLSDILDIPKSHIVIKSGLTGKQKTLVFTGITASELTQRVQRLVT